VSRPFFDATGYSGAELFWYVGGFLAWTPAYVAIIVIAVKERRLEIPVLAMTANISWEFLWGFFYGDDLDMGWGLQGVYVGAFLLDACILYAAFRFGREQANTPLVRRLFPVLLCGMLAGWIALIAGLEATNRDLPLGSVSAYLVNLAESGVYLWFGLTILDPRLLSQTVAWSKGVGTAMVSVFVLLRYGDDALVIVLAAVVFVLDAVYIVLLTGRRRGAWGARSVGVG
jgi:hypothetical protein